MRKIIAAAAFVLLGTAATASASDRFCAELHEAADAAATARYQGIAITRAMAAADLVSDPDHRAIMRAIVMDAYALPDYRSPERQDRERREFANEVALWCYHLAKDVVGR